VVAAVVGWNGYVRSRVYYLYSARSISGVGCIHSSFRLQPLNYTLTVKDFVSNF
jgi:hypothetical protein